jgi:hypothetical protein
MTDWLIAFADGLPHRLRCCTVCGRAPLHWGGVWQMSMVTLASVLCVRCHTTDPAQRRLRAIRSQRDGADLRGEPIGTCLQASRGNGRDKGWHEAHGKLLGGHTVRLYPTRATPSLLSAYEGTYVSGLPTSLRRWHAGRQDTLVPCTKRAQCTPAAA